MNRGDNTMINTFQELHNRFDAIAHSTHNVTRTSAGAVGELFEELMEGEIVGNDRGADFAGINTEAKVHHGSGVTTVFTFAPSSGISASQFKSAHGSTVVRADVVNGHGHSLTVSADSVSVTVDGQAVAGWTVAELSARIVEKMPNLAIVTATKSNSTVTFDRMAVCRNVIASRFIDSIRNGNVVIEMRGSRGVTFRAMPSIIEGWFEVLH
jgi:hypothetical protein